MSGARLIVRKDCLKNTTTQLAYLEVNGKISMPPERLLNEHHGIGSDKNRPWTKSQLTKDEERSNVPSSISREIIE